LAIIATATASNVWLILPAILIIVTFVLLRWYYLKAARDVKRLEAIGKKKKCVFAARTSN
jgi:ATP-binding cassette subfamily C (CFTR/MRP) protein 4